MRVAGVDGTKGGWVAVELDGHAVVGVHLLRGVETSFEELASAEVIAIDVPIGFGPRDADALARAKVGGSSVFAIPAAEKFEGVFGAGKGVSAQAFALGARIRHVTTLAQRDGRFREAHPEVCFWAMNGGQRLGHRKKTAGGTLERIALLETRGIALEREMLGDAGAIPLDDVLDAAACAWTAARIGNGSAVSLPDHPQKVAGASVAIWY